MVEHTPGPWTITVTGSDPWPFTEDIVIKSAADARLIAAAPRLLKAAEGFVDTCDNCGGTGMVGSYRCGWCRNLRDAIAQVRSES